MKSIDWPAVLPADDQTSWLSPHIAARTLRDRDDLAAFARDLRGLQEAADGRWPVGATGSGSRGAGK